MQSNVFVSISNSIPAGWAAFITCRVELNPKKIKEFNLKDTYEEFFSYVALNIAIFNVVYNLKV